MPLDAPERRLEAHGSALADEVYDLLASAIVDGRLAGGEHIRDVEIAQLYGISRTPVREAIQRLERQGLVEIAAHRYTRVTTPDDAAAAEATEYIGYVSAAALRQAVRRADDAKIAELCGLIDEIVDAAEAADPARFMERMVAFHRISTIASGNRMLTSVIRETHVPVIRVVGAWLPYNGDSERAAESFRSLRRAVQTRDADEAERIVRDQHGLA